MGESIRPMWLNCTGFAARQDQAQVFALEGELDAAAVRIDFAAARGG